MLSLLYSGKPNCSVKDWVKPRSEAPSPHPAVAVQVISKPDERKETVPVLSLNLTQFSDGKLKLKIIVTEG